MSDLENKKTEETPKKRPYNLREKKEKKAAYRSLIRPELADELYDKILNIIVQGSWLFSKGFGERIENEYSLSFCSS